MRAVDSKGVELANVVHTKESEHKLISHSFWFSSGSFRKCCSLLTHGRADGLVPSSGPEPACGVVLRGQEPVAAA